MLGTGWGRVAMLLLQMRRLSGWLLFFFSSRRRHTIFDCDWSSDVCSSDLSGWRLLIIGARELRVQESVAHMGAIPEAETGRSEERRVGKECRSRWSPYH